jgi:N-acetylglucosamine-6-phosphate deacetylase
MYSMNELLKIYNGQIITSSGIIKNGTVLVRNGIIENVSEGDLVATGATEINANNQFIGPGLIDIQINGFMGVDFSDQELSIADMRKATEALWKVGVTTYLPTVITNSQKNLKRSFSLLSKVLDDKEIGMSIRGFHLEGPYISPVQGFRGAHLEKYVREPEWKEFSELQKEVHDRIVLITVAPEVNGAISFIRKCTQAGIVVSLGHHNGSSEIIKKAVGAGASMVTHLGNGCANMINRHDNPFWPQLANDELTATIIADGYHLNQDQIQCFYRMKGLERTILVSDALDLAGLPPGEYTRLERQVVLTEVVKFPAENVLAGAASPLSICVSNMMKFTNCSLENAIQMASANPARSLGLKEIGELKPAKRADVILFKLENGKIKILKTIISGKIVFSN